MLTLFISFFFFIWNKKSPYRRKSAVNIFRDNGPGNLQIFYQFSHRQSPIFFDCKPLNNFRHLARWTVSRMWIAFNSQIRTAKFQNLIPSLLTDSSSKVIFIIRMLFVEECSNVPTKLDPSWIYSLHQYYRMQRSFRTQTYLKASLCRLGNPMGECLLAHAL